MNYLINCSFNYYAANYLTKMNHYALIVRITYVNETIEDAIIRELKNLNFNLPISKKDDKSGHNINLNFTAQKIKYT